MWKASYVLAVTLIYHLGFNEELQLAEIEIEKVHNRGLTLAKGQIKKLWLQTPDYKKWCIAIWTMNVRWDPICNVHTVYLYSYSFVFILYEWSWVQLYGHGVRYNNNSLLCKAIHTPQTCRKIWGSQRPINSAHRGIHLGEICT